MSLTSSQSWNKLLAAVETLEQAASKLHRESGTQRSGDATQSDARLGLIRNRNREAARRLRNVISALKRATADADTLDLAGESREERERREKIHK